MSTGLLKIQSCMILLERIYNSSVLRGFFHGKLFAVAFKIFANVIHRNVMSVFKTFMLAR